MLGAKPCTYLASRLPLSPNGLNQGFTWASLPRNTTGLSKTISKPTVCLAQTMHLSSVKITTIYKRTESSFHLSLITEEYHRLCPKWFLSQWYVWRKPCTYLASRLPLSPNGLNRACTWVSSPRSTTGWVQNDFRANGMFGANCAPMLHWH
jgi:hypothetical protein